MLECACTDMLTVIECDRFIDHVRERINAALIAEIEAERAADEAYTQRVLYGDPEAPKPVFRGVIRG